MNVIVLTGPADCGKTTTLTMVKDLLVDAGWALTGSTHVRLNDYIYTLEKGGKKVAILTDGDYARRVIKELTHFNTQKFDVFITACNDRHVTPFKHFNNYPNHIIRKQQQTIVTQRNSDDTAVARTIFNLI